MNIIMTSDTYWPRKNGVAVSIDAFKNEFNILGHNAHLFCTRYPMTDEQKKIYDNPTIHRFPSFPVLVSKEDYLVWPWQKKAIFREMDAIKPDIVHVQTEFIIGDIGRKYCRSRKVPMVMTCHTYFEQYINHYVPWLPKSFAKFFARTITGSAFNKPDLVIVPSQHMKDVLLSYGVYKPIEVVPTGLDPKDFEGVNKEEEKKNSELYQKYPQLRGKRVLLYVGRVGQEKNMDFLIEVMKKLVPTHPDTVLLVVGGGPYKDSMEKIVQAQGLQNNVIMHGYHDRAKLKHVYAFADIFVFASKTETQGLVTIEAMLCGTPAVAVGEMGSREVMNGDNGGYMVKDDVDEFTAKVKLLLEDDQLYRNKCREALEYSQKWTVEPMSRKMLALYEKLVKK
jgi:glycosyltransferase involved in cell wall biosynthesis